MQQNMALRNISNLALQTGSGLEDNPSPQLRLTRRGLPTMLNTEVRPTMQYFTGCESKASFYTDALVPEDGTDRRYS